MKRILVALAGITILSATLWAVGKPTGKGYDIVGDIPQTTATTSNPTIASPGANLYNCLTQVVAYSTGTYTLRILEGSTTNYQLTNLSAAGHIIEWPLDDAYCTASSSTAFTIKVTPGTGQAYDINYKGYIRQ